MNRRNCLVHVSGTAVSALAGYARASPRPPLVGILFPDGPGAYVAQLGRIEKRLQSLGFTPGKDILLEARYATAAADIDSEAKVLAASGAVAFIGVTLAPTVALGRATASASSPVLFVAIGDPVARGLVADMNSPGGRFTGSSDLVADVAQRRMDLLAEVVPTARVVALISNASITPRAMLDAAAARHGMRLVHVDVRESNDFRAAYEQMAGQGLDALVVTPNGVTFPERHRLAAWARERKIPTLFGWREFMDAGGLLSLGADTGRLYEVAAEQLVQVLRGVPVPSIPVARPQLELVVDLRTASQIGVTVPPAVLARANALL